MRGTLCADTAPWQAPSWGHEHRGSNWQGTRGRRFPGKRSLRSTRAKEEAVKNSSPWFESVGGAPPISAKVVAAAISTVRSASSKIGATGPVVCFLGSHVAVMSQGRAR